MSHDEERPSIRGMVRELVQLGVDEVKKRLVVPSETETIVGPSSAEVIAERDRHQPTGLAEGTDRSMMVEALVVGDGICLTTPPNELVYGVLAYELCAPSGSLGESASLVVQNGHEDTDGIGASSCVPLIRLGDTDTYRLKMPLLIGSQEWIGRSMGRLLPPGTKLRGYALGAIHPSKMGGAQVRPAGQEPPRPGDKSNRRC